MTATLNYLKKNVFILFAEGHEDRIHLETCNSSEYFERAKKKGRNFVFKKTSFYY